MDGWTAIPKEKLSIQSSISTVTRMLNIDLAGNSPAKTPWAASRGGRWMTAPGGVGRPSSSAALGPMRWWLDRPTSAGSAPQRHHGRPRRSRQECFKPAPDALGGLLQWIVGEMRIPKRGRRLCVAQQQPDQGQAQTGPPLPRQHGCAADCATAP